MGCALWIWLIWVHSGAFCCIWVHSGAFEWIWVHVGAFRGIQVHSGAFGCIPLPSVAFGCIWVHLGAFGCIWVHSGEFGFTWVHLGSLGLTWVHLGSLGFIGLTWVHFGSLGFTWVYLEMWWYYRWLTYETCGTRIRTNFLYLEILSDLITRFFTESASRPIQSFSPNVCGKLCVVVVPWHANFFKSFKVFFLWPVSLGFVDLNILGPPSPLSVLD